MNVLAKENVRIPGWHEGIVKGKLDGLRVYSHFQISNFEMYGEKWETKYLRLWTGENAVL